MRRVDLLPLRARDRRCADRADGTGGHRRARRWREGLTEAANRLTVGARQRQRVRGLIGARRKRQPRVPAHHDHVAGRHHLVGGEGSRSQGRWLGQRCWRGYTERDQQRRARHGQHHKRGAAGASDRPRFGEVCRRAARGRQHDEHRQDGYRGQDQAAQLGSPGCLNQRVSQRHAQNPVDDQQKGDVDESGCDASKG